MQSPGAPRLDNGHGACVADEHVACTKQVRQELPVSHWSVTAHYWQVSQRPGDTPAS